MTSALPTELVGSLPRPAQVQRLALDAEAGLATAAERDAAITAACRDTVRELVSTGSELVSDGEQSRTSFADYLLDGDQTGGGEVFAVFADGHHRVIPQLRRAPFRCARSATVDVAHTRDAIAAGIAEGWVDPAAPPRIKQAVVSPSMLSLMYPAQGLPGYSRDEFVADVVRVCQEEIIACFTAGAARVSLDFTEGRLALREDLPGEWAGPGALGRMVELMNEVLDGLPSEYRPNVGVHTCPGNDRDSQHSAGVSYARLIPELFQIEAGYFLIQAAGESEPDEVAALCGRALRQRSCSLEPQLLLGVTSPTNPRIESPREVCDQLVKAARFIPAEQLGSTDDCGFSPYLIDDKPRHGSPDFARRVAFAKIAARVEGTRLAAQELSGSVLGGAAPGTEHTR